MGASGNFQHSQIIHVPSTVDSTNSSSNDLPLLKTSRSTDVEWAIICMTALLVILVICVCYSQMWRHRDNYNWYASKPSDLHYNDLFTPAPQISIKELLKSKLEHLSSLTKITSKFKQKLKKSKTINGDYVLVNHQGEDHVCAIDDSHSEDEIYTR